MANEIMGALSYLAMSDETTWGTLDATKYVHVPVEGYDVKYQPESRMSDPFSGVRQRKHARNFRGHPAGALNSRLRGYWVDSDGDLTADMSLAQYLMDWWLLNPEDSYLPSKTAEWAEGPDVANVRHTGLRVNSGTLQGSADSGVLELAIDLIGQAEANFATAQSVPTDLNELVEFDFTDVTFTVNSSDIAIDSFSLAVQRNLVPKYNNSTTLSLLGAGEYLAQLSFVLQKNADTYAAAQRTIASETDLDIQINATARHLGTGSSGTLTTLLIDMPMCRLMTDDATRARAGFSDETIACEVLKPDSAEDAINVTWGVS